MLLKMILLFSHSLTEDQINDAVEHWNIEIFVSLPENLRKKWAQFPPDNETILPELEVFKKFLRGIVEEKDIVLVQGDYGATCHMVGFARSLGAIPVYATTRREVTEIETEQGIVEKRSQFQHRRFRQYDK